MALVKTDFAVMGDGNGSKMAVYRTADAIAVGNSSGYFNDLSSVLSLGDVIFVQPVNDPAAVTSVTAVNIVYVNGNASGVVDVTEGLAVTATDTD